MYLKAKKHFSLVIDKYNFKLKDVYALLATEYFAFLECGEGDDELFDNSVEIKAIHEILMGNITLDEHDPACYPNNKDGAIVFNAKFRKQSEYRICFVPKENEFHEPSIICSIQSINRTIDDSSTLPCEVANYETVCKFEWDIDTLEWLGMVDNIDEYYEEEDF